MVEVKWIKIVTNIFDDEKLLIIESMPDADTIIVIWFKLLCLAGKSNNNGFLTLSNEIPYTEQMLASVFRRKEATVKMALDIFERLGMIEIIDNIFFLTNWEKYQNIEGLKTIREQARLRKQKQRAKLKEKEVESEEENKCHAHVTHVSRSSSISISNISNNSNSNIVNKDIHKNINIINKELYKAFGEYEWIKLKQSQYDKLKSDFPKVDIDNQIKLLDEYVQSNGNKNKYKDFNLVLRKSIRENWFNDKSSTKKEKAVPKWFDEFAEKSANTPQVKPNIPSSTLEELESFFNVKKEK